MATVIKSIGTASRDYSTITLWEADLDDTDSYSAADDAVGECHDDSAFNEDVTINGGEDIGLTSVTLTVALNERHDGTAGTGARNSGDSARIILFSEDGTDDSSINQELSWLELDGNGRSAGLNMLSIAGRPTTVARVLYHSCAAQSGTTSRDYLTIYGASASKTFNILNCIGYDLHNGFSGSGQQTRGIYSRTNKTVNILAVTLHDIKAEGSGSSGGTNGIEIKDNNSVNTVKNCIVTDVVNPGSGSSDCFALLANNVRSHNLSSDATADGTGSLTSKASADQFVSTTSGSEDFHLKSGADARDAATDLGTTPSDVQFDIDGRDRDAQGDTWDMGADEFVSVGILPKFEGLRRHTGRLMR